MSWSSGFNTTPQASVFTSVEEQVQRSLKGDGKLDIRFQNTKLTGFYLLPLYKNGSCQYSFDVGITGENSKVLRGTGNGEIDFSTFGIISVTEVKEKLSEQIAADLVSTLKRETK